MEKVREIIRKYEDPISTVLQLFICIAAVALAFKKEFRNIGKAKKKSRRK